MAKCRKIHRSLHTRLTKIATSLPGLALDKARAEWRQSAESIKNDNKEWLIEWANKTSCPQGCVKRPDYILAEIVEITDETESKGQTVGEVVGWIKSNIVVWCLDPEQAKAWKDAKVETFIETLTEEEDTPPTYDR